VNYGTELEARLTITVGGYTDELLIDTTITYWYDNVNELVNVTAIEFDEDAAFDAFGRADADRATFIAAVREQLHAVEWGERIDHVDDSEEQAAQDRAEAQQ